MFFEQRIRVKNKTITTTTSYRRFTCLRANIAHLIDLAIRIRNKSFGGKTMPSPPVNHVSKALAISANLTLNDGPKSPGENGVLSTVFRRSVGTPTSSPVGVQKIKGTKPKTHGLRHGDQAARRDDDMTAGRVHANTETDDGGGGGVKDLRRAAVPSYADPYLRGRVARQQQTRSTTAVCGRTRSTACGVRAGRRARETGRGQTARRGGQKPNGSASFGGTKPS